MHSEFTPRIHTKNNLSSIISPCNSINTEFVFTKKPNTYHHRTLVSCICHPPSNAAGTLFCQWD